MSDTSNTFGPKVSSAPSATTRYDPSVITHFADALYAEAARVVFTYGAFGSLIGALVGGVVAHQIASDFTVAGAVIGAGLVGLVAVQVGRQKAFALRLQAQLAPFQLQIEANTRLRAR